MKGRSGFAILADASKAHRRVRVRPEDWGLQGCRIRPGTILGQQGGDLWCWIGPRLGQGGVE